MTTTTKVTPADRLQAIQEKIVASSQRVAAINEEYQVARLKPDTHLMRELIVEATALQDALPVLQCQHVAAEIEVMEYQKAEADRRVESLRGPMIETDNLYREAEQRAGAALAEFRQADEEAQTLTRRIDNVRIHLAQIEREASQQAWRP